MSVRSAILNGEKIPFSENATIEDAMYLSIHGPTALSEDFNQYIKYKTGISRPGIYRDMDCITIIKELPEKTSDLLILIFLVARSEYTDYGGDYTMIDVKYSKKIIQNKIESGIIKPNSDYFGGYNSTYYFKKEFLQECWDLARIHNLDHARFGNIIEELGYDIKEDYSEFINLYESPNIKSARKK